MLFSSIYHILAINVLKTNAMEDDKCKVNVVCSRCRKEIHLLVRKDICDLKVKCPNCDELLHLQLYDFEDKEHHQSPSDKQVLKKDYPLSQEEN